MENELTHNYQSPTKVMCLCWGFSIHVQRRIQIFIDDPGFAVTVVSTYNYNFPLANNVLLSAARVNLTSNKIWDKLMRKLALKPEYTWLIDCCILARAIQKYQPNIIFLQTLLYPCFLAYFLPRYIPQIVTFWNGDITWWAKWNGIERLFKKHLVTYGVRRASAITVNSQTAYNAALTYGVAPSKIHIIGYPGVDLEKFHPLDQQLARQKLGLTARHILFWPRGLGGYLNSEIFIQALAKVASQVPDILAIVFTKVGGPAELKKHQQLAQDLGISDKLLWITEAKFNDMPWYYASANAMISLSSNDSRPNVMLEAMACGTPVIMGDIPATREWITADYNGYLVPPRDIDQLAKIIVRVLDPKNQTTNRIYAERSLQLVRERADSPKNIILIKQLVHQVAHATTSEQ